ncbi:short-chain dehydrogenase [Chitinophaga alhagiae]|uniref:Short-chain dehydrogenase n=1 Tax=Chitinophaga alhagiae TaxID=2203219 RepID=A0ABN5LXZ1_9BACT|nr:SDR family oxidoreductase [Chitinophaga alhagiae]AWO01107.1 short-chain dehydrogenase [Chitinophaga alhagiae]
MNNNTVKVALVTGGSRGLGKDMALALAQQGTNVIFTYNSQAEEAQTVLAAIEKTGRKAAALQLNVAATGTFNTFVEQVNTVLKEQLQAEKIDYLVNNAGIGIHVPFASTTEEQFDTLMNIHLKGTFFLTQKMLPLLADGGGIVNLSSGLARFSIPGFAAYAAMKGAIETLSRYQAKELGGRRIRVNVVAPGPIETDFGGGAVRDNREMNSFLSSQTALGRVGMADDIGCVVAFLCSDAAKWVNAQRIEASGGIFL